MTAPWKAGPQGKHPQPECGPAKPEVVRLVGCFVHELVAWPLCLLNLERAVLFPFPSRFLPFSFPSRFLPFLTFLTFLSPLEANLFTFKFALAAFLVPSSIFKLFVSLRPLGSLIWPLVACVERPSDCSRAILTCL